MQNPLLKVAEKRHEFQNMEWLNLHTSIIRAPEYIGSDPIDRATWINVLTYCCEQENGGKIIGAAHWKDRQWQQTCGVTLREVRRAAKLVLWLGDDVEVFSYPQSKEDEVRKKRESGRAGGVRSGIRRAINPPSTASSNASSTASSTQDKGASTEGKGKEGNGREPCASTHPSLPQSHSEAIAFAGVQMIPPDFIRETFDRCMAVGWIDTQGRAIASWPHYLAKSYADAKQRSVTTSSRPGAPEKGITFV